MSELVERAARFAANAHLGQKRKYTKEPYVAHPGRVARNVQAAGGDENQVVAALLHDTVEDTAVTLEDVEREFGSDVAPLVWELTHVHTAEALPHLNRAERKRLEAERLSCVSPRAKLIKMFDVLDNLPSVCEHDPGFAKVYAPECRDVLAAVCS